MYQDFRSSVHSTLAYSDLNIFSGVSLKPLKTLSTHFDTYSTPMVAVVPGNLQLIQFFGLRNFTWRQSEH